MSIRDVALRELQKRVGQLHPVAGFKMLDQLIEGQEQHLENFEQLLCAMAFDKGMLAGVAIGLWQPDEPESELRDHANVRRLLRLESPGISAHEVPTAEAPRIIQ